MGINIKKLNYCRSCLNKKLRIHLTQDDVIVYYYPSVCSRCKKMKNIVRDVCGLGRLKLLFRRR